MSIEEMANVVEGYAKTMAFKWFKDAGFYRVEAVVPEGSVVEIFGGLEAVQAEIGDELASFLEEGEPPLYIWVVVTPKTGKILVTGQYTTYESFWQHWLINAIAVDMAGKIVPLPPDVITLTNKKKNTGDKPNVVVFSKGRGGAYGR
jgi:hypothetical protein